MPRFKKFNTKKRSENQIKATELLLQIRDIKNDLQERHVLKHGARRNNAILPINYRKSGRFKLTGMHYLQAIINRIKTQVLFTRGKNTYGVGKAVCLHVASLGSSQLHKLTQPQFQTVKSFHQRVEFKGAKNLGKKWEDEFFERATKRMVLGMHISFLMREKTWYSGNLPWICATPDFIGQVTYNGHTDWAVIEIKSTTSERVYKNSVKEFGVQVKASIDAFGLNVGYLVTVHVNKQNVKKNVKVEVITEGEYLKTHRCMYNNKYAKFLRQMIYICTGDLIEFDVIYNELDALPIRDRPVLSDYVRNNTIPSVDVAELCGWMENYVFTSRKTPFIPSPGTCAMLSAGYLPIEPEDPYDPELRETPVEREDQEW